MGIDVRPLREDGLMEFFDAAVFYYIYSIGRREWR